MKNFINRIIACEEIKFIYNFFMMLAALTVVVCVVWQLSSDLTPEQAKYIKFIDISIWLIFTLDYVIRIFYAKEKLIFFKKNIIELLAIIPLDMVFQGLRILVYITRLFKRMDRFIKQNNFNLVLWLTFATIFCGAIAISYIESMPMNDAIWWAFVTASTVGYGDISPTSTAGRLVAVILMLVGIGFIGILTGNIATYFLNKQTEKQTFKSALLEDVIVKLKNFENLDTQDIDDIYKVLKALKESTSKNKPTN